MPRIRRPIPAGFLARRANDRAPLMRPETIPAELTGKFLAWSADGLKILGSGGTSREALAAAGDGPDLILEWVPPMAGLRVNLAPPRGVEPSAAPWNRP